MLRTLTIIGPALLALTALAWAAPVPDAAKAPGDAVLIDTYAAKGVQIYRCAPAGGGLHWTLVAPDAELKDAGGGAAHHSAGPTWQAARGAKVVGEVIGKAPAPMPGSVAWLLLSARTTGTGTLAGTRYVQRLNTVGGAEPAVSCEVKGAEARIPYTADYAFYR